MRRLTTASALALLLGAATILAPAAAGARPSESELLRFYSDESFSLAVGTTFTSCSGAVYRTGVETPYFEVVSSRSCGQGSPGDGDEPPYSQP